MDASAVHLRPHAMNWQLCAALRREALALYREVLRYSNLFVWKDAQGRAWRDVIRTSTRKVQAVHCAVHHLGSWRAHHLLAERERGVLRVAERAHTQEFEDARIETDPEIINKLIITGRDAVQRTVEAFMKKRRSIIEEEAALQERGAPPRPEP